MGGPLRPRAWIDLEQLDDQWFAALGFDGGRVGGLDTFKGPYFSREAAERNAAAFGCDFMRARGLYVMASTVACLFGFPSRRHSAAS